jgi:peptidoglycan/xylan/chitin deacetylase (PgdA/CDA1 family)
MKASLKALARRALAGGPAYPALRARALRDRPVTLLTYHTLGADDEDFDAWTVLRCGDFERQVALLRRDYEIVDLDTALDGGAGGRRPRAVLTFDDGHTGWIEHLLPIVEREALPVTLYVATAQVQGGVLYWFDAVVNALQSSAPLEIDASVAGLGRVKLNETRGERNWLRLSALLEAMKAMEAGARDELAAHIVQAAASAARPRHRPLSPLDAGGVRTLARSRWVTIGSHSHGHELLDRIALPAALDSIARSIELLADWTGRRIEHFAYPNGNHSAGLADALAGLGLKSAVTTRRGLWRGDGSRYLLPRVAVGRFDDDARFKLTLLG